MKYLKNTNSFFNKLKVMFKLIWMKLNPIENSALEEDKKNFTNKLSKVIWTNNNWAKNKLGQSL